MTLRPSWDPTAASWITGSALPWRRLVTFGPAGLPAYARLRFIPDPVRPGQRENDHPAGEGSSDSEQVRVALGTLARFTTTPDDCWFCLWDGWYSDLHADDGSTAFPREVMDGPRVHVPNRAYHLFRGPLADAGDWGITEEWRRGPHARHVLPPAFVWPADRAWCLTADVDPHWAGIGADVRAIDELVADRRLDVVRADPAEAPPVYL